MIQWMLPGRRMVGGLYFGPPGWSPDGVEDGPTGQGEAAGGVEGIGPEAVADEVHVAPEKREALVEILQRIGLGRTSAITSGLCEQMQELGERRIRALVVNLLPTQPEFAIAAGLTRAGLPEMIEGLRAIQRVVRARRVIVVADRHDWRTRRLWRRGRRMALAPHGDADRRKWTLEVRGLSNQYPVAHPTILLRRLFGKRLEVGQLPLQANRMIVDPVACWGLGRCLRSGRRFTQRPVQLFIAPAQGSKEHGARLVMSQIGEKVESLCARYGARTAGMQVIVNGMLAGEQVDAAQAVVEPWTESVALRQPPEPEPATPCFACGWCVDVCPTRLNPVSLLALAEQVQRGGGAETVVGAAELRSAEARESLHCTGCGLCSYVCPTRLPLAARALRLRKWVESPDKVTR